MNRMFAFLLLAPFAGAQALSPADEAVIERLRGAENVLFDALDPASGLALTSQNFFLDIGGTNLETNAADDFVVDGDGWTLIGVLTDGEYDDPQIRTITSMNIVLLADDAGKPATVDLDNPGPGVVALFLDQPYSDPGDAGNIEVTFAQPFFLPPGRYWLNAQAQFPFDPDAQGWDWEYSNLGVDNQAVWFESLNAFAADCPPNVWHYVIADCPELNTTIPDMSFAILGFRPDLTGLPTTVSTVEGGDPVTYEIALTAPPAGDATVQIDLASSDESEGLVSPAQIVFDSANWDVPVTVTVTPGPADDGFDCVQPFSIVHTIAAPEGSGYARFAGDFTTAGFNASDAKTCAEDLNGDGFVDGMDLAQMYLDWPLQPEACLVDFSQNGILDVGDMVRVNDAQGECP